MNLVLQISKRFILFGNCIWSYFRKRKETCKTYRQRSEKRTPASLQASKKIQLIHVLFLIESPVLVHHKMLSSISNIFQMFDLS